MDELYIFQMSKLKLCDGSLGLSSFKSLDNFVEYHLDEQLWFNLEIDYV